MAIPPSSVDIPDGVPTTSSGSAATEPPPSLANPRQPLSSWRLTVASSRTSDGSIPPQAWWCFQTLPFRRPRATVASPKPHGGSPLHLLPAFSDLTVADPLPRRSQILRRSTHLTASQGRAATAAPYPSHFLLARHTPQRNHSPATPILIPTSRGVSSSTAQLREPSAPAISDPGHPHLL